MASYLLTTSIIGVLVAISIILLVRRGRLHGPYAVWWLSGAAVFLFLGLFPQYVDRIGSLLGVNYPPILAVIAGFVLIMIKVLLLDLERSRQEVAIRRLTQRVAILQTQLQSLQQDNTPQQTIDDLMQIGACTETSQAQLHQLQSSDLQENRRLKATR